MSNFKYTFVFDFKQADVLDSMMLAAYRGLVIELSSIFDKDTYELVWSDCEYYHGYESLLCLRLVDEEQLAIVKLRYSNLQHLSPV